MYRLSDEQIEFIRNDIRARGVEMDSLQDNLLDHVCCIIENKLEENGDFTSFYEKTIRTFYKDALWEIEEETISLLTFKNYYAMKKIMILSGIFSATTLSVGIFFKFMYWPGAAFLILAGVLSSSLIFLPLVFITQIKEKETRLEKLVTGMGILLMSLMGIHVLFKVMHWPGGIELFYIALVFMVLIYIPSYFFTGFRNPVTKGKTVVFTLQLIILTGMFLTPYRTPKVSRIQETVLTKLFVNNEEILKTELRQVQLAENRKTVDSASLRLSEKIFQICSELKAFILKRETGFSELTTDFESKNALIHDSYVSQYFDGNPDANQKVNDLTDYVKKYNTLAQGDSHAQMHILPSEAIKELVRFDKCFTALNMLSQLQLLVLQNERELLAKK